MISVHDTKGSYSTVSRQTILLIVNCMTAIFILHTLLVLAIQNMVGGPVLGAFTAQFGLFLASILVLGLVWLTYTWFSYARYGKTSDIWRWIATRPALLSLIGLLVFITFLTLTFVLIRPDLATTDPGILPIAVSIVLLWSLLTVLDGERLTLDFNLLRKIGLLAALGLVLISARYCLFHLLATGSIRENIPLLITIAVFAFAYLSLIARIIPTALIRLFEQSRWMKLVVFLLTLMVGVWYWAALSQLPETLHQRFALLAVPLGGQWIVLLSAAKTEDYDIPHSASQVYRLNNLKLLAIGGWVVLSYGLGMLIVQRAVVPATFIMVFGILSVVWICLLGLILPAAYPSLAQFDAWLSRPVVPYAAGIAILIATLALGAAANQIPYYLIFKVVPAIPLAMFAFLFFSSSRQIKIGLANKSVLIGVLVAGLWAVLWLLPWHPIMKPWPWLRMGIAILLFTFPGILCASMLQGTNKISSSQVTLGFATSIAVMGLLATIVRSVGWSFSGLMYLFAALGIGIILAYGVKNGYRFEVKWLLSTPTNRVLWLLVGIVTILTMVVCIARWGGDEVTNQVYINRWQNESSLDYNEIYFDGTWIDSQRYWMSHFLMVEAALGAISGHVTVLLLSIYLDPFFAILALASTYDLARSLNLPVKKSWLVVIVHGTALLALTGSGQPGYIFIRELSQDKSVAAFVIAPIFFRSTIDFFRHPSIRSFGLLAIIGIGLMYTHPTGLGIAALTVGIFAAVSYLVTHKHLAFLLTILLLISVVLPPFLLRYVDAPFKNRLEEVNYFSVEDALENGNLDEGDLRRMFILNDPAFYAFNAHLLVPSSTLAEYERRPGELGYTYGAIFVLVILAVVTGVSAFRFQHDPIDRFVLSASVTIWLAIVPYTAPLLGTMIGAPQLWRVPWSIPYGILLIYFGQLLSRNLLTRLKAFQNFLGQPSLPAITGGAFTLVAILYASESLPPVTDIYEYYQYGKLSEQISELISEPAGVVGFGEFTNDITIGSSPYADFIYLKHSDELVRHGLTREEAEQRVKDWKKFNLETSTNQELLALLNTYQIMYMVTGPDRSDSVNDFILSNVKNFEPIQNIDDDYTIFQVRFD